ncbi:radical SAM domain-containing protein [Candidatus Magnetobacterium bavaricum]|uniref:Radical SAM domain-containing protein n=1 Tax=Candidatus Magnetobacterium bavaricum TaxID=29290 RepID=A0A0F3GHE7_9BACT|nr:radical SAM domain-containing protein [Candidatus Magnetobacterium bavaricum]
MYYYFNPKSLIINGLDEQYGNDESRDYILVDNNLQVIANKQVFIDALANNDKYVKGKRLNLGIQNPPFPQSIGIEISSQCNYHCKMCPRRKLTRPSMNMESGIFYKIVDEIRHYNIKMLGLYRLGESLKHPEFFDFMEYIGLFDSLSNTFLSTNGGLLTDSIIERLLVGPLKFLNISMNALDGDTYRRITGMDHFDRVSSLSKSIRLRKTKRTPFISFQFLEQDMTFGQVPQFVDEYIEYADFVENSVLEDFGGQLTENAVFLDSSIYNSTDGKLFPCPRSKSGNALIYSNGDVVPCICDINAQYIKVGNIHTSSLKEMYEGEAWMQFRQMHTDITFGDHPLCGKCRDRLIFDLYKSKDQKNSPL